ncbi:LOW QUALITY PROTEIN: hypothetical protein PHPALM_27992 [Phytophthora palmivora]|uniref:Uncharacterized protein n=1 Tax=Phytophthora palmivora TaxID=4796 RepID=A0A2P4XB88_9STRA|nr:LOW QUALITY PROTEIN: hypothetical protein PHPALM_27992 [Phytophthora palmivora]
MEIDVKSAREQNGTVENKIMDTFCLHQCQMTIGVVHADLGGPLAGVYYCLTVNERQFCWNEVMMQRGRTAGPEFTRDEFQVFICSMAVKPKPISTKTQVSAICERVDLEIPNTIRISTINSKLCLIILLTQFVPVIIQCCVSPRLKWFWRRFKYSPIEFSNWSFLSKQRFASIMQENHRENLSHIHHFYQVGDQVMLHIPPRDRRNPEELAKGPFLIKQVSDNDTILLDKGQLKPASTSDAFPPLK